LQVGEKINFMASYLTEGPITAEQISAKIENLGKRTDAGGHSIFLGQVRADLSNGRKVKAIEYSAYEQMVGLEAEKIRIGIFSEFSDVLEIVIIHSTGVVKAGEISMFVLVSAGHRDHAATACRTTVELIKEKLPVWKKEIFEDDSHTWKENSRRSD
jgi:molybdopterin synthase catalytic subunit